MRYLNEQYRQAFAFLRGPLAVYLKNTAITFAVIALVFYGTCLFLPNVRDSLLSYIQNIVDSAAIATEAGGFPPCAFWKTTCAPPLSAYSTESFHFFLSPPFQSG